MLYIGMDLGTSAVKLLLMDNNGIVKKVVSKEYPLSFPHPGWAEQNPEDWLSASLEGIRELTAECDKSQVAGIGCGGQMHGLVALDKDGKVLRPAILWNDGRTAEETDYLNTVVGKEKLSQYTANIAFAGFTAPKLLWMRKHEPGLFEKIDKIMLPKDYLNYMLTGVHCTDVSDASGTLLEGVAFAIRDCLEVAKSLGIDVPRSKICGGGARSALWRKIFANVLNINIDVLAAEEGPGYGGAILAAVAYGEYATVKDAAEKLVQVAGTISPDPEIAARYDAQYQRFRAIYPSVKSLFQTLNEEELIC